MNVFVSGKQLECALLSAAKQDIRYYLNGVYCEFTPDNTRIVTTNGHHMLVMDQKPYQDNEWTGSFIIPRDVLEQLKPKSNTRFSRHLDSQYCITVEERVLEDGSKLVPKLVIREMTDRIELTFTEVEGKFPDYTRIIPAPDLYNQIAPSADFNIEYLMLALKLYRVVHGTKNSITVPLRSVVDQIGAVRLDANSWFFIMPIRHDKVGEFGDIAELDRFRTRVQVVEEKPLEQSEVEQG